MIQNDFLILISSVESDSDYISSIKKQINAVTRVMKKNNNRNILEMNKQSFKMNIFKTFIKHAAKTHSKYNQNNEAHAAFKCK